MDIWSWIEARRFEPLLAAPLEALEGFCRALEGPR